MTDELDIPVMQAPGDGVEAAFHLEEGSDEVLRLQLDKFEGPLDLLLYLIKVQEIDIFDIPIVKITDQYLHFLDLMREENLDITGEFLVIAATLIQIKSRMLLPADADVGEEEEVEEEDPRIELVEKLLEYRRFREISQQLVALEETREMLFTRNVKTEIESDPEEQEMLEVTLYDLIEAFRSVLRFFKDDLIHSVTAEGSSVDEKIEYIQARLAEDGSVGWFDLFRACKSRVEMVCSFLAILELCRMGRIRVHQYNTFEEIRLFPATRDEAAVPPAPEGSTPGEQEAVPHDIIPSETNAPNAPEEPAVIEELTVEELLESGELDEGEGLEDAAVAEELEELAEPDELDDSEGLEDFDELDESDDPDQPEAFDASGDAPN